METRLTLPEAWEQTVKEDGRLHVLAPASSGESGWVVLEVYPLRPWGADPTQITRTTMSEKLGAAQFQIALAESRQTVCGWNYLVSEAQRSDAAAGRASRCIVACYRFLRFLGVVSITSDSEMALGRHRSALEDVLASAAPDWRDSGVPPLWEIWTNEGENG